MHPAHHDGSSLPRGSRLATIAILFLVGAGFSSFNATAASLVYSEIFNAGFTDAGKGVVVDGAGNAFVIANPYEAQYDVLVLKLGPDGSELFSSWLRGGALDYATDIALDGNGDVVITGWTASTDFPTENALQDQLIGTTDAFIVKLDGDDGRLLFSTFLGGSRGEQGYGIAVGAGGDIVVTGATDSVDFPTLDPFQGELNLLTCFCSDAFVTRLSGDGQELLFSTYLGGNLDDAGRAVEVDAAGTIHFAGETESADFPLEQALFSAYGGSQDAFAAAFSGAGDALVYSTYLGGEDRELVGELAVAADGTVSIVGTTRSTGFPTTPGAFQPGFAGAVNGCGQPPFEPTRNCDDVFLTRISADGSSLAYSTFIGGNDDDFGTDLALGADGRAILVGHTLSPNFPGSNSPRRFTIYLAVLNAAGDDLHTVQLDSPVYNQGHGVALSGNDLYLTAAQNVPSDIFVARVRLSSER